MPAKYGYWNIRGLGQDIRFILEYTKEDYVERTYNIRPNQDKSDWLDEKFNLGLDFPNLPYYIDGDVKLTQSSAILKYIARKHKMCGMNETEEAILDMIYGQLVDLRVDWSTLVYDPEFESLKKAYIGETFPKHAKLLSDYLGNKQWLIGNRLTYVDFCAYELFYVNSTLMPSYLEEYPNLKHYVKRFEALEGIKRYMASSRYFKNRVNSWRATFGSD